MEWPVIEGKLVKGHQVASGMANDDRFPEGTLALQAPLFAEMGFPIDHFHFGTLNISIAPKEYETVQSIRTFRNISWHPKTSPEDFSFYDCRVRIPGEKLFKKSLVYRPHPETKPEHFQESTVLEVIAPWIENISYGVTMELAMPPEQIRIGN